MKLQLQKLKRKFENTVLASTNKYAEFTFQFLKKYTYTLKYQGPVVVFFWIRNKGNLTSKLCTFVLRSVAECDKGEGG